MHRTFVTSAQREQIGSSSSSMKVKLSSRVSAPLSGLKDTSAIRTVSRAHVIAWRKDMETRSLGAATIRRKLSALSSLFDYLCERNAVAGNPVDGVKRPTTNNNEAARPPWVMRRHGGRWRPLPRIR